MTLDKLFATNASTRNLALRLVLAATILPHGLQKLLGWFGGYGFTGTMGWFVSKDIPAPIAFLVIVAESFGALAIALGLVTRAAAAGLVLVMLGAIFMVHLPNGFFMNWFGNQAGEGFEYFLPVLAIASLLVVEGAGRASVDRFLAELLAKKAHAPALAVR